ncbi:hypothetical protein N7505_000884 [Penicillium chrysogenum]|uniref:Uncharacterized protein n=1 Tax=Penicillium chrysogenum TaxID=5076 RepID=A0ABQ8WW89_PENCH|nr:hypothetical protein N7505_000884 [Penicillium chrysogenum]
MVFLRLSIKVFPREQLSSSSSSSWGRTLLGARKTTNDDSSQGSAVSTTLKKPGVFLLVLEHPEEVSLGGLAGMIQEHWAKLHPELEPLAIKKILDDTKEDLDLYPDLTVADVWVDYGKARTDGLDQRGSVRVIQRPTTAAPERFPSVDQDWDAAIVAYERKRAMKDKKEAMEAQFPAIQEEDEDGSVESPRTHSRSLSQSHIQWGHSPASPRRTNNDSHASARSPVEHRHRDLPLSSVEIPNPVITSPPAKSMGPTIAGTPPPRRESEELGESPSPAERRASSARSQPTPTSAAAGSPEPQPKSPNIAKRPIARSTAKRTITQMPDDAESPPIPSAPNAHQQTQSTEEATASSSHIEAESAPRRIVKLPFKPGMANGVNGQGHLAAVAKSVSKPPQKEQAEPVTGVSSDGSSEEESEGESDIEDDKVEAENKTAEQDKREAEDQAGSDDSDDSDDSEDSDDSDDSGDSESDSESDASEENGPKDEPITPRVDHSVPITEDLIDPDGDVQMEEPVVTRSSKTSDQSDLSISKTDGTTLEARSRKRKQAPEESISVKEARQGQAHPSTRPSTPPRSVPAVVLPSEQARQSMSKSPAAQTSPLHRRARAPSFSSPARQASVREENEAPPKPHPFGIGLGITQSPPSKQPVRLDLSQESDATSTQNSFGESLSPSSNVPVTNSFTSVNKQTPVIDRTKKLHSAIRGKDSPATERRSVSFAEGESLASSLDAAPRSTPRNAAIAKPAPTTNTTQGTPSSATSQKATPKNKSAVKPTPGTPSTSTSSKATPKTQVNTQTPKSTSQRTQAPPSSSDMIYPPGFDIDQLTQQIETEKKGKGQAKTDEKVQKEKESAERTEIERKLRETHDNPQLGLVLTEMHTLLQRLANSRLETAKRKQYRARLEILREHLKACEQGLEAQTPTSRQAMDEKVQKGKESAERTEIERKLRETHNNPQLSLVLTEMHNLLQKLANSKLEMAKRKKHRARLDILREDLKACEQGLEAQTPTSWQAMDEKVQKGKESAERTEIERKLRETHDNPQLGIILTEMRDRLQKLANSRVEMAKRKQHRARLEILREHLKACEQRLEAQKSTPRQPVAKKPNMTLKDMLSSQKQEMAAKLRPERKSAPAPRSDVYEVPSSGESESASDSSSDEDSESDSEAGDIMPDGQSVKLPKPRPN